MDYARILNQYRSLTVGFQQNITGSNRYPKIFVTAPSLRPVLSIASICELESMDNNHCAIYFGIAKLKLTTDREREIICQCKNPPCESQMSSLNYNGSGDARKNTPDLFTAN